MGGVQQFYSTLERLLSLKWERVTVRVRHCVLVYTLTCVTMGKGISYGGAGRYETSLCMGNGSAHIWSNAPSVAFHQHKNGRHDDCIERCWNGGSLLSISCYSHISVEDYEIFCPSALVNCSCVGDWVNETSYGDGSFLLEGWKRATS